MKQIKQGKSKRVVVGGSRSHQYREQEQIT